MKFPNNPTLIIFPQRKEFGSLTWIITYLVIRSWIALNIYETTKLHKIGWEWKWKSVKKKKQEEVLF